MRPCTRRIVPAENVIKAPALTTSSANTLLGADKFGVEGSSAERGKRLK